MPDPSGDFNSSPYVCTSFSVATAPSTTAVPPAPAAAPNTYPIYSRTRRQRTYNSPIVLDGPLPPNFIPRTLTNSRGVSTPISRSAGLLCMGTHSGMSIPVIPPPVFPSSGPPAAQVYGNPLAKTRDREEHSQQQPPPASPVWGNKLLMSGGTSPAWANKQFGTPGGGVRLLPPSWGASSPAGWGNNNMF